MPSPWQFLRMMAAQSFGPQRLEREPEPDSVTVADGAVTEYDRVLTTKLALIYAAGIHLVRRILPPGPAPTAVDLACGPGHFTLSLARYLECPRVVGVDLSPGMVATAAGNAERQGLADRVEFRSGDVRSLPDLPAGAFGLATFTDAAHHLEGIPQVEAVLGEMERLVGSTGVVLLLDLARLRTRKLTERYIEILGHDYRARNLVHFLGEFRNSMYAAYTPAELAGAVPVKTRRRWVHLVPRGLPTMQALVGLPEGRTELFLAPPTAGNPLIDDWTPRWAELVSPAWAAETRKDWKLLRLGLAGARKTVLAN